MDTYYIIFGSTLCTNCSGIFSQFLFACPIPAKDALSAITQLFTTYGVPQTLASDQGSEYMAQMTKIVCESFRILKQWTRAFIHHCLGACERTHRTLAKRLTLYIKDDQNRWDQSLPFGLSAVNSSLAYYLLELFMASGCDSL